VRRGEPDGGGRGEAGTEFRSGILCSFEKMMDKPSNQVCESLDVSSASACTVALVSFQCWHEMQLNWS
jgi:hypothetical protein